MIRENTKPMTDYERDRLRTALLRRERNATITVGRARAASTILPTTMSQRAS